MSMIIFSKIFISEGRGQPVSLNAKIDGCSDHGCNHDIVARIWKDTLKRKSESTETRHYEVETTTEVIDQNEYYFVLGERTRQPNEITKYQQNLYAISASGSNSSRSLGCIQSSLFTSDLFEGSEVNQNAIIVPTLYARKVNNRFIMGATATKGSEEHYQPGSFFRICQCDNLDFQAAHDSHNTVAVPCNDLYENNFAAEMRHAGKGGILSPLPQTGQPVKSMKPDLYVAPNTASPLKADPKTPQDVIDFENMMSNTGDVDAFEEKGSYSSPTLFPANGKVFSSVDTGCHDHEQVVMTRDWSLPASADCSEGDDGSVMNTSSQEESDYSSMSSNVEEEEEDNHLQPSVLQDMPMAASVQATRPESRARVESTTVAEEEVFEQEVPPTPIDAKQLHYSTSVDMKIEDCVKESVDVEPVEEKSCNSPIRKVTEARMEIPASVRTQQQCLNRNEEEALVIPSLNPMHKPTIDADVVKRRLCFDTAVAPQQSEIPNPASLGIDQQPPGCNGYTPTNQPARASLQSQSIWPGQHPTQQQDRIQDSFCNPPMMSVPNPLGHFPQRSHQFSMEQTTTRPNALKPTCSIAFTRKCLYAWYPLTKGKVIYSAPRTKFSAGSTLPLDRLDYDHCQIGSGGNGSVFSYRFAGKNFAIKKTEYRPLELELWSQFDHPNVIPLLCIAIDDFSKGYSKSTCWQIMPQMEGDISQLVDYGTLDSIRDKKPEDSWLTAYANAKHVARKTLCALDYLHSRGIVHQDIKERNVFYTMRCEHGHPYECVCSASGKCEIKVGDFDAVTKVNLSCGGHVCGTRNYRSPELLSKDTVNYSVDIYAFGCMLMKLCDGRKQYKAESEGFCRVMKGSDVHQQQHLCELLNMHFKLETILASKFDDISEIGRFIKICVNSIPDERPTASVLLKDSFFNQ